MAGLKLLCLAYVLSQFFRAFLAVLSTILARDIGAAPEDLAAASGLWFASFALMQLPVGWALDHIGPRRTASSLLLLGGVGCSPVLMASYYIFAREYPPARFATLAALMLLAGTAICMFSRDSVD